VKHEMRRAEALDALVAEIEPVPGFSAAPVPQLAALGPHLDLGEGRFQAERKQNACAVGADLDAGADLLELARMFVTLNVDAALEQGPRRGQPTDAGADDNHLFRRAHGGILNSKPSFFMGGSNRQTSTLNPRSISEAGRPPRNPQFSAGTSTRMIFISVAGTPISERFLTMASYKARFASSDRPANITTSMRVYRSDLPVGTIRPFVSCRSSAISRSQSAIFNEVRRADWTDSMTSGSWPWAHAPVVIRVLGIVVAPA